MSHNHVATAILGQSDECVDGGTELTTGRTVRRLSYKYRREMIKI